MRRILAAALAVALMSCSPDRVTHPKHQLVDAKSHRYIVVFRDTVSDVRGLANRLAGEYGSAPDFTYEHALRGFAARFPVEALEVLSRNAAVAYVEPDQVYRTTAQVLPWGIDRVDADLSSTQAGNGSGAVSNVNIYILDTGVRAAVLWPPPGYRVFPPDLTGGSHVNFVGDGRDWDCNGHGAHVAGIAAARDNTREVVGVAPGAPVTEVRVIQCNGEGATSTIIAGIDWVTGHRVLPAVANMSLGGPPSEAMDDAITMSVASGVVYVVSAGNNAGDACDRSPARVGTRGTDPNGILTVAATDDGNEEAGFSNFGPCVEIWAPGVNILSLVPKATGGTTVMSGTSMAAPHVAGGAALFLSQNWTAGPSQVETALKSATVSTGTLSKDGRAITLLNVSTF